MVDDVIRLTTDSLLDGLKARSEPHWIRFVRTFGPLVVSWIRNAGVGDTDLEDVAQEVFSSAAAGIEKYRHDQSQDGSFRRWLWGITRNRIQRHYVRLKETPKAVGDGFEEAAMADLPSLPFEDSDPIELQKTQQAIAMRALNIMQNDFEERTWRAFWNTVIDGRKTADVAASLEMSSNQVRQYRSRVLRRLRSEFGTDINVLVE